TEVITLSNDMRENTVVENQLIKDNYYKIANNVTTPLLPPAAKAEVPFLNFASLQNAVSALEKATNSLNDAMNAANINDAKKAALNIKLYKAEQTLLTKDGLPRR